MGQARRPLLLVPCTCTPEPPNPAAPTHPHTFLTAGTKMAKSGPMARLTEHSVSSARSRSSSLDPSSRRISGCSTVEEKPASCMRGSRSCMAASASSCTPSGRPVPAGAIRRLSAGSSSCRWSSSTGPSARIASSAGLTCRAGAGEGGWGGSGACLGACLALERASPATWLLLLLRRCRCSLHAQAMHQAGGRAGAHQREVGRALRL